MAHEWNIRPRGRSCAACETPFTDGQECLSALLDTEEGYDRRDYCLKCRDKLPPGTPLFSQWQSDYSVPATVVRDEPVRHETAESLLRRLIALEEPRYANVAYILAVMLERKKQLVERDAKPNENGPGILRVYEHKASGDTFVVLDPQLRLDEIGPVQQQVLAMLKGPVGTADGGNGTGGESPDAASGVTRGADDFDLLIFGGNLVDGTGAPARQADVGIRDGRIVTVGTISPDATARRTIRAEGLVVAPGFIDAHSHSDAYLLVEPDAPSKVRQGVTTEVIGQCGGSAAPLIGTADHPDDWHANLARVGLEDSPARRPQWGSMAAYREMLAQRRHAPNVVALVGHNTLRAGVMGYAGRTATGDELHRMTGLLEQAIDEGASGFSTGLIYMPGRFSAPEEVLALAQAAAAKDALYATHMRSEGDLLEEALEETLALARATGIRTQISHLKTSGSGNWGKLGAVLGKINAAREAGLAVHADRYPYCVSATSLRSRLPAWVLADSREEALARVNDPVTAARIAAEMDAKAAPDIWANIRLGDTYSPTLLRFRGATIASVAEEWRCTPAEAFLQVLRMDKLRTEAFFAGMSEDNMRRIYAEPWVMVGSDASIRATSGILSEDFPHPRNYGTFARFLRLCLSGELELTLEEAIRRMTSLPAKSFSLQGRGVIEPGAWADVVVFDKAAVRDLATFEEPHRYAAGFSLTVINGEIAFDGQKAQERPGRWLTGTAQ